MDERLAEAITVLYRSSIERGKRLDEAMRQYDLDHKVISSLHDLVLAEEQTARSAHRCHACERDAEFYWHDAGPFGAGTVFGCATHVPDDDLGGVEPLKPGPNVCPSTNLDPGHSLRVVS